MLFTLITPCSRPDNLKKIKLPDFFHEWIIVYDGLKIKQFDNPKIKEYTFTKPGSFKGSEQRNFALKLVNNGFVYFLDDDNIIHPNFYMLKNLDGNHFYTFNQKRVRTLKGNRIHPGFIDTGMFLIDIDLAKNIMWNNTQFHDGEYIKAVYDLHPDKWVYINKTLSYYNKLKSN